MPQKSRLYTVLIVLACHLTWNMRHERRIKHPGKVFTEAETHNRLLQAVNNTFQRDRILTDERKFGPLAIHKQIVLNTWSGLLLDEESLPDDWIFEKGVLVGILPMKQGVG